MAYIYSNKLSINVGQICNCPPGDVCANPDGSCPSGSFPDNANSGCCIQCNQLIPANITVNVPNTSIFYMVDHRLVGSNSIAYGPVSSGCSQTSCSILGQNKPMPDCYMYDFNITGKVTDSAGHGICNLTVSIEPEQSYYVVSVNYSEYVTFMPATVTIDWQIIAGSGEATTDSDGNFSLNIKVWAFPISTSTTAPYNPGCYAGTLATQPITVKAKVKGTAIQGLGVGDVYLYTWDNGGW